MLARGRWAVLGLMLHHGVDAAHFLHDTHRLPGLEPTVRGHRHDFAALARLPGRKFILTNAPRHYALRVLGALGIGHLFDGVFAIEDMAMFGQLRPKPDARMLRRMAVRLRVPPGRCVLVEDTLVHQKAARRVGMRTVWIRTDESVSRAAGLDLDHIHHQTDDLATWLADWVAERNTTEKKA